MMAGNERQFDSDKPRQRPDILRAKDIIPGNKETGPTENQEFDIPRFDLAKNIMSEHRRLTAYHRKGPGITRAAPADSHQPLGKPQLADESRWTSSDWDPLIADIVSRDIERFCAGVQ